MTAAEKAETMMKLKAAAYDALVAKQQAQQAFEQINQQIVALDQVRTEEPKLAPASKDGVEVEAPEQVAV